MKKKTDGKRFIRLGVYLVIIAFVGGMVFTFTDPYAKNPKKVWEKFVVKPKKGIEFNSFCYKTPPLVFLECINNYPKPVIRQELLCTEMKYSNFTMPENITFYFNDSFAFADFEVEVHHKDSITEIKTIQPRLSVNNDNVNCTGGEKSGGDLESPEGRLDRVE
jgi:hypothetical protein